MKPETKKISKRWGSEKGTPQFCARIITTGSGTQGRRSFPQAGRTANDHRALPKGQGKTV
ncbi:hypothetical protein P9222_16645 [Paenibacillus amylolyticus]|nr:hypothetical protein [Paenibacillus amylolyticus]WFR65415.1 hypothetical protein P9222_16645 [Paenibacillus amylolyticus]